MQKDEYTAQINSRLDKLVLAIGFFAFLAALIVGVLTYISSRNYIKSEIFEDNLRTAHTIANIIEKDTVSDPAIIKKNVYNLWEAYNEKLVSSFVCAIDSSGRLMLNSKRPEKVGVFVGDVQIPGKDNYVNNVSKLLKKQGDWVGYNVSHGGIEQLAAYTYSKKLGGLIAVHADADEVNAQIDNLVFPWVLGWFVCLFILFPAALLLSRKLYTNSRSKLLEATQILHEKDQQFVNLFETAREGIFIHNKDGKIINANNAALQIFGLTENENFTHLKIIESFENEKDKEKYIDVLSGSGYFKRSELHIIRRSDRAIRLISISTSCSTNTLSNEIICQSIFSDVTDKVALLHELEVKSNLLQEAQTLAELAYWGKNMVSGEIFWSDEIFRLIQKDNDRKIPEVEVLISIIHPEDREKVISEMGAFHELGVPLDLYFRIIVEGEIKYIESLGFAIKDDEGNIVELKGTLQDVSKLKNAEIKLEESLYINEEAQKLANLGYFNYFIEDNIWEFSTQFKQMIGYESMENNEENASDIFHFIHPDDAKEFKNILEQVSLKGGLRELHHRVITKAKSLRHFRTVFEAKSDYTGKNTQILCAALDVTDTVEFEENIKKLNEDLERRVEERTQELKVVNLELEAFSYSVSHDLRAPLRAIDGFAKILELEYGSKLDAEAIRLIKIIRKNSDQMSVLVDDLLEFAKTAKIAPIMEEISIESLIKAILRSEIIDKDLDVDVQISELPIMLGDRNLMKQVWVNLISNSIKFTKGKPGRFIKIYGSETESETLYVIEDNGVGFNDSYADRIFDVFHRLHSTDEFPGTGVGLAIVQRIIHRHGGSISAEGKESEGAKFYITIPKQFDE